MTIALWIINVLLAVAFLGAGSMKLAKPKEALVAGGMAWAEDFSASNIKLIGAAQVLGALGLILPFAFNIAPLLTPIAAACLATTMLRATAVHAKRKEPLVPTIALALLSIVSAVIGFIAL